MTQIRVNFCETSKPIYRVIATPLISESREATHSDRGTVGQSADCRDYRMSVHDGRDIARSVAVLASRRVRDAVSPRRGEPDFRSWDFADK